MNSHSELPDRKRRREEENPNSLSSPEQNSNKKKKKKGNWTKKKKKNESALIPQDPPPSTTEPNVRYIQLRLKPNESLAEPHEQHQLCPNPNPVTRIVTTAIPIDAEKGRGAEPNGADAEHPVSDSTPQKRKNKKKKDVIVIYYQDEPPNALQVESEQKNSKKKSAEPSEANAVQPQVCHKHEVATVVETATPVVQEKKNCVELKETSVEQPRVCSKQELVPMVVADPGKEKGVGANGGAVENPIVCSKHDVVTKAVEPGKENGVGKNQGAAVHPELVPVPDTTPSKDTPRKKKWEKKKKNVLGGQGVDSKGPNAGELQPCDPVGPAISIGMETKIVKEIGAGPNNANAEQVRGCSKHELAIPIVPQKKEGAEAGNGGPNHQQVIPVGAEKNEGARPNEASAEHPKLPLPVSDPTPRKDTPQKRKWERKKKNVPKSQGAEPKESNNAEHTQVCSKPKSAPDPQHVIRKIPTNPEQKLSKKKRKKKRKSVLKGIVAEPNNHNGKPSEIPVQRSICPIAAPQTDQKISTDQKLSIVPATPIGPKQKMAKKKKQKKRKSALKSKGSESDKHNTKSTDEIPVSKYNAEPSANTGVRRTKGLKVTKISFKRLGESSMRCRSCQQPGHKFKSCPRLKYLPDNEEICFFCGEIGHSLGKCSVSQAGGGRFARCLFCYAHGHFTNKCPRNGRGIDLKVVAADGPTDKNVEAEGNPIAVAEATNSEQR